MIERSIDCEFECREACRLFSLRLRGQEDKLPIYDRWASREESARGRRLYIAREKEKRGRERNAKAEQVSRG
jgi:hypothetical protein